MTMMTSVLAHFRFLPPRRRQKVGKIQKKQQKREKNPLEKRKRKNRPKDKVILNFKKKV
jgi:hypothetical protein